MSIADLQREAFQLDSMELKRLIGMLISEQMRRSGRSISELSRRLDDKSPGSWLSLEEARKKLT